MRSVDVTTHVALIRWNDLWNFEDEESVDVNVRTQYLRKVVCAKISCSRSIAPTSWYASIQQLSERSANIFFKKELSPYLQGKIIRKAEEGKKPAQIAKELQIADSTVRDTLKLDLVRNKGASQARLSRLEKYSVRFKRVIVNLIRKELKSSFAKIRKHLASKVNDKVIRRILEDASIYY
ncbi:hypothetical protein BKA65DRAFT_483480 [Rhexocercosporidium sp. MPI-PUGE-AT-0058]|nr:hypothetical protein BKA65DRAFT_483480 [Rhexocercosporidium sp. MPI-PUGE-AT-0058]